LPYCCRSFCFSPSADRSPGSSGIILQITLVGWVPAAIWAVYALSQFKTDEKIADLRENG
jgi:hypothetical protein